MDLTASGTIEGRGVDAEAGGIEVVGEISLPDAVEIGPGSAQKSPKAIPAF